MCVWDNTNSSSQAFAAVHIVAQIGASTHGSTSKTMGIRTITTVMWYFVVQCYKMVHYTGPFRRNIGKNQFIVATLL